MNNKCVVDDDSDLAVVDSLLSQGITRCASQLVSRRLSASIPLSCLGLMGERLSLGLTLDNLLYITATLLAFFLAACQPDAQSHTWQ